MSITKKKYNMIVAADMDWCIGKCGDLLDHFPEDMKFFRKVTSNKIVIMGKRTQESLPNKTFLKNRLNIILNDKSDYHKLFKQRDENTFTIELPSIESIPEYIDSFHLIQQNTKDHINIDSDDNDIFVIGGGQVYRQFLEKDLINTIYLTKIHHSYNGDTFIPNLYALGFKEDRKMLPIYTNENGIKYEVVQLIK